MQTTKLSSKGQVVIPKPLRKAHHWEAGQELVVVDVGDGVLFKPRTPFEQSELHDVASCLNYTGTAKTLVEMDAAIGKGIKSRFK